MFLIHWNYDTYKTDTYKNDTHKSDTYKAILNFIKSSNRFEQAY